MMKLLDAEHKIWVILLYIYYYYIESVCIQYLEALKDIVNSKIPLKRTIHLSFVPDEEISGGDGMKKLVADPFFKSLNIGMTLDEGIASETNKFTVFYGEKAIWWLIVRATGPTGHASRLPQVTAMQNLITCINSFLEFRATQYDLLHGHGNGHQGCSHSMAKKLGDVVSLNLTMLKGGVSVDGGVNYALNVIPNEVEAGFDLRLPVTVDLEDFENNCIKKWTNIDGMSYRFVQRPPAHSVSSIEESSFWWKTLSDSFKELNLEIEPEIFPAATDSRFIRPLDIPAFGFSPMRNEKVLLHDHNERIKVSTFLEGIKIYTDLIPKLANAWVKFIIITNYTVIK